MTFQASFPLESQNSHNEPEEIISGECDVTLYRHFLCPEHASSLFDQLRERIEWQQDQMAFFGRIHDIPRLQAWYADKGLRYNYSGLQLTPRPWTPELSTLKEKIERKLETDFNAVLANLYRSGGDHVSWHSDNEDELGVRPKIASLSLGEERKFVFRHKESKEKVELFLNHGSLLFMSGETQNYWEHMLPKSKKVHGERLNFTFRKIHSRERST